MAKYMDSGGLSHFMTKIKSWANGAFLKLSGGTMTGMLVAPKIRVGRVVYGVSRYLFGATAKETIIYTGIKFVSSSHMPVVHMSGFAYGAGRTTELHIAMYIYQNEFYSASTITNLGAWNPTAYLFTYVKDSTTYVAIGLSGNIYYNMMNVDVQDEMGNFANIDVNGWVITPYTDTGHIPAEGTDHCRKLNYGIDVLKPPVGNAIGTLPIANGGTGKTTAAEAWTALGGGAIGKKASLAASDIPAHASTATTYGAASTSNYGHAKLSSATNSSSEVLAATPKAVKAAYDLASGASTTAGKALSAATGAYAFKVTYSVSGTSVVCAAHVYSAGAEVTTSHAESCFSWSMSLDGGTSWTALGTGRTKTVSAITAFGGNVKCDFTPAS